RREVVEGDDRFEAVLTARGAHAAVVLERRARELAVLGFDPAPLEREAIRAEAQFGAEPDVGGIAMPVVAGGAARFLTGRIDRVLPRPPVVVPVTAFHLVGGRCRTPDEAVRKAPPVGQMRARSHNSSTPGSLTYATPSPGVSIRQRVRPSPPPSR